MAGIDNVEGSLATSLFDALKTAQAMVAGLQQHIEERAKEIATPEVDKAKRQFRDGLAAISEEHTRAQRRSADLIAEMRRQLDAQLAQVERLRTLLGEHGIDPRSGLANSRSDRGPILSGLARELYADVERFHDRTPDFFARLPQVEQDRWYRVATHALESTVDHVIEAGRPVWWTEE